MEVRKKFKSMAFTVAVVFALAFVNAVMIHVITVKMPMQKLKITAVTAAGESDISGTASMYYFKPLKSGESYTAKIRFMAVENTSQDLLISHGKGKYVYLGCGELYTEYDFVSFGRFLHIKLTVNAAQTDLKLEDGTPFDITRYSLRPVFTIEGQ